MNTAFSLPFFALNAYLLAGMDELEFTEAESNMNDMISEYESANDRYAYDDVVESPDTSVHNTKVVVDEAELEEDV